MSRLRLARSTRDLPNLSTVLQRGVASGCAEAPKLPHVNLSCDWQSVCSNSVDSRIANSVSGPLVGSDLSALGHAGFSRFIDLGSVGSNLIDFRQHYIRARSGGRYK